MSKNLKVLITGGAGFIGSQLGYALSRSGCDVILLDNFWAGSVDNLIVDGKSFGRLLAKDIRSAGLEEHMAGVDSVVHLAGIAALPVCQTEPQFAFDVNTSGTANILEAARRAGVKRVVFSSTSAVYENNIDSLLHEGLTVTPNLVYASTKLAAENICKAYAQNYGMDIIISRFFNVYGPHQDFKRKSPPFTSYVARELLAGRPPMLYNNTGVERDYVHSIDVIKLLIKMLHSPRHYSADIFNVASGRGHSVPEIFEMMRGLAGQAIEAQFASPEVFWNAYEALFQGAFPLKRERVTKEVYKSAVGMPEKTEVEFQWKALIEMKEGLQSVIDYAKASSTF